MKLLTYKILFLFSVILLASCSDDDEKKAGNPVMDIHSEFNSAMYGDSLPFTIAVSDDVPLSTLKARIYYGSEKVSEVVIRTKANGSYSDKIYVPFYKDMADQYEDMLVYSGRPRDPEYQHDVVFEKGMMEAE